VKLYENEELSSSTAGIVCVKLFSSTEKADSSQNVPFE